MTGSPAAFLLVAVVGALVLGSAMAQREKKNLTCDEDGEGCSYSATVEGERGFKTWRSPATHPQCVFCSKRYGGGRVRWNVIWTQPLQKQQLSRIHL